MRRLLIALLLTGCAATTSLPPASLSLDELDEMASAIEDEVTAVDEAFCDAGGGDPMANCYIGTATADVTEASELVCDDVVPVVDEWTSASVNYIAFDSRDDQTIGVVDC